MTLSRRLFKRRRRGSVGLEAVMAFPAMLVLFGAVSQVMITSQSRVHLEQAAYAAARSALVYKCPDFNLIAELRSAGVTLTPSECLLNRDRLNAIAQQKAEDAARWALVAAAPTTGAAAARGCDHVPAAEELMTGSDRIQGRDQAVMNAICYVFEPGNVTVETEWDNTLLTRLTGQTDVPMKATVTFLYPLSTPFRRFILNDGGGQRPDGTYFRTGSATVTLL